MRQSLPWQIFQQVSITDSVFLDFKKGPSKLAPNQITLICGNGHNNFTLLFKWNFMEFKINEHFQTPKQRTVVCRMHEYLSWLGKRWQSTDQFGGQQFRHYTIRQEQWYLMIAFFTTFNFTLTVKTIKRDLSIYSRRKNPPVTNRRRFLNKRMKLF